MGWIEKFTDWISLSAQTVGTRYSVICRRVQFCFNLHIKVYAKCSRYLTPPVKVSALVLGETGGDADRDDFLQTKSKHTDQGTS